MQSTTVQIEIDAKQKIEMNRDAHCNDYHHTEIGRMPFSRVAVKSCRKRYISHCSYIRNSQKDGPSLGQDGLFCHVGNPWCTSFLLSLLRWSNYYLYSVRAKKNASSPLIIIVEQAILRMTRLYLHSNVSS